MTITDLGIIVSFLIAISLAAERLVEAVKKIIPWLETAPPTAPPPGQPPPGRERARLLCLYILAFAASWFTAAWLANDSASGAFNLCGKILFTLGNGGTLTIPVVVIGLLGMGGSKFWKEILEYVGAVKEGRKEDRDMKRLDRDAMEKSMHVKAYEVAKR